MEAVAKLPHGVYVAAFSSICIHLAAKCAFYISRTNQYDFSTLRLNDDTKQPKVHVRSSQLGCKTAPTHPHTHTCQIFERMHFYSTLTRCFGLALVRRRGEGHEAGFRAKNTHPHIDNQLQLPTHPPTNPPSSHPRIHTYTPTDTHKTFVP